MRTTTRDRARRLTAAGAVVGILVTGCGGQSPDSDTAQRESEPEPPASEETSASGPPATTAPPTPEPSRTAWDQPDVAEPLTASEPSLVEIPALDVSQETVSLGLTANGSMQVPEGAEPIGWFDRSPTPGEIGPAVLAGHVTWNGTDGVFRDLGRLSRDDRILVTRADGSTAEFAVTRVDEYDQDEFPTARVYGNTSGPELRLITCSGDYDAATRSFSHNTVVYATMTTA